MSDSAKNSLASCINLTESAPSLFNVTMQSSASLVIREKASLRLSIVKTAVFSEMCFITKSSNSALNLTS